MALPDLVLSVPDLQAARILSAAGIPYISLLQSNPHISDIAEWLEGTKVGVQIIDPEAPIPQADFLVIPVRWYETLHFIDKPKIWILSEGDQDLQSDLVIYPPGYRLNGKAEGYFHLESIGAEMDEGGTYLDWVEDAEVLEGRL